MGEKEITLDKVIGHEDFKGAFLPRLKSYPAGVYLFYGPASVGKRTTAFEVAKMILCKKELEEKCGCISCKQFDKGHPDFLCVGGREKIKVADVDSIIEFCTTTPFLSDSKIIIIDDAHIMTVEAANRLLKLLEEPPLNYSFFLITSNPQAIISTILSRCIRYEFGGLSREDLTSIIKKKLGFSFKEAETLGWLAASSSLDVFTKAGEYLKYRDMALELLSNMKKRHLVDSIDYIDKMEKEDLPIFSDMLVLVLTDLLLLKYNILEITNRDKQKRLLKIAEGYNYLALIGIVSIFSQVKRYLYLNINLNLYLKNVIIRTYPLFMKENDPVIT